MVAIYVQRTWLKTIGDVADLLLVTEHEGEYVSFLAGKIEINFPFVEAKVARKESDENEAVVATSSSALRPRRSPISASIAFSPSERSSRPYRLNLRTPPKQYRGWHTFPPHFSSMSLKIGGRV